MAQSDSDNGSNDGGGEAADGFVHLTLSSVLDFSFSGDLYSELRDHVGSAVVLDGSCVRHLGAPCVQVLVSAARFWRAQGVGFSVDRRSEAFVLGLERMGIGADELPVSVLFREGL